MSRCTKAFIHKNNLKHNIEQIRKFINPDVKLCFAVKADAYGHDAVLTSKIAEECGADFLAVATVEEGIELREAGITIDIILLSLCTPEEMPYLFKYSINPLIFNEENIKFLSDAADEYFSDNADGNCTKFNVFLAVDTGMGRIGCYPEEAGEQASFINSRKHLKLEGVCSHLCVSDGISEENISFTKKQGERFRIAVENIRAKGIEPEIFSCGSSAALLAYPELHFNMIRPGIIAYGYYPDEVTEDYLKSFGKDIKLKPVLSFETKVVAIRTIKKGESISYGRTFICEKDTRIAVLPVGYADGLLRRFSPGLCVTINGKNYPVRGRICMDQCMVEIGFDSDVKLWDRVVIFGPEESGALNTADTLAKIGNTISYEVLTSISKRVKKYIVE